ncbi:SpoIIE family protein phosphatase [Chitinasiproducens palmae]|uniref:Anti-sigma regulatory factor (Ser/Thr protein kinase) n=1 Tax=Chitinasiproducens palmae TaxID=1770053 RepID=A0A1H2PN63_9BURK|nr:SpoIIE family protein phosphatase [Chitinasiproducens palmae]SDV48073.1 Anti-sigma regulatory factor (Ser/Thr protein kinase) [Chitinasiproducens palmae]
METIVDVAAVTESVAQSFDVRDPSDVGEIRRQAAALAAAFEFDETASGRLAIVASELATNVLKHGRGGEMLLAPVRRGGAGLALLALDRGPGIVNIAASMRDGYSTGGSLGVGMGAIERQSDEVDLYSRAEHGTAMLARVFARTASAREPVAAPAERQSARLSIGALCLAKRGQQLSGDSWAWRRVDGQVQLLVVDGLGYGPQASATAAAAVAAFRTARSVLPSDILNELHRALKATRGAVAAIASIDPVAGRLRYAGVGNINGLIRSDGGRRHLMSADGTLGYQARVFRDADHAFERGASLIMHSDGMATRLSPDGYPGLLHHDPDLIAGVLYRDFKRDNDDATIAVVRLL